MADTEQTEAPDYVTLVSNDGFEFVVQRTSACLSGAIKRMLDPTNGFAESKTHRCVFENINGMVLEKVCEYFYYNEKNRDNTGVPDLDIPPELCLELLMAADYLNAPTLLTLPSSLTKKLCIQRLSSVYPPIISARRLWRSLLIQQSHVSSVASTNTIAFLHHQRRTKDITNVTRR
ncbi:hypothetical protein E4T39_07067 [Aureobasidium subglaciale]|nr:hypothetical protein E4T39_07067 [Aureobasidium subglaciale]